MLDDRRDVTGRRRGRAVVRSDLSGHDLTRASFRRQPIMTADALLRSAVGGVDPELPDALRAELLTALGADGRDAYRLLTGPGSGVCAAVILPHLPSGPTWWRTYAEALADGDTAMLTSALTNALDARDLRRWQPMLDNPARWFRDLAAAVGRTGPAIDAVWRHARSRIDAEEARFEVARRAVSGLRAFVNDSSEDLAMTDGEMRSPGIIELDLRFSGNFVVAPQVSPAHGHIVIDHSDNLWAAYSLPTVSSPQQQQHGQLTALLGPARAAVLLALDAPISMGQLARELEYAPSTITHHADRLAASGLVVSVSRGRHVWLSRTYAGHLLVDALTA